MLKKLLSVTFRELVMHRHVGFLADINGSVTDELTIKYIVSFDIRLSSFEAFSGHFRRLTSKIFRGGQCPQSPQVAHAYALALASPSPPPTPHCKICSGGPKD